MNKGKTYMSQKEDNILIRRIGVIYAICASFCLTSSMLAGKKVKHLGGPEISWLRSCIMACLIFPFVLYKRYKLFNYKGFRRLLFTRAICLTIGSVALYTSILLVPLPDATAVKYCSVAITPLFAALILKERVTILQLFIIIVCLFGIVCIANPFHIFDRLGELMIISPVKSSGTIFNHSNITMKLSSNSTQLTVSSKFTVAGVSLAFITSICEALAFCITRKLSCAGIPASVILLNLSAYASVLSIPICVVFRSIKLTLPTLSLTDFGFITISGTVALLGHGLMVKALHREHTGLISVIRSMDILFSFAYQYAFFNVHPTRKTFIGAGLIVCSIVCVSLLKIKKNEKTPKETNNIPEEMEKLYQSNV